MKYFVFFTGADNQVACAYFDSLEEARLKAEKYQRNGFTAAIVCGEYVDTYSAM